MDDLFCAGGGKVYENTLNMMKDEIQHCEFRFCGKNINQMDDFTIQLDQFDSIEGIDYMPLSKDRCKMVNAPLKPEGISNFWALNGQMGWVTRQTRLDLMGNVSVATQNMSSPKIKDVITLNKTVPPGALCSRITQAGGHCGLCSLLITVLQI